jgi:long-chain fatty acid transport protein
MKTKNLNATACLLALGLLALSGAATATNGYFTHGVGTESKGMAGTGVGSDAAHGPIIAASNPALAVFAEDNWEVGLAAFSPMRDYEATGGFQGNFGAFSTETGKFESGSEWFPIPYLAKNWRWGDDNTISFLFYGRGGMNTDWDDPNDYAYFDPDTDAGPAPVTQFPGVFGGGDAGVDLSQAFLALNFAGKAGDNFAWGIGPVFALQMFEAKGVGTFAPYTKTYIETFFATGTPGNPTSLTNNGHDTSTGYGAAAGIWWAMGDAVSAGLAYQSKMSMSELDDYSDLFAESGGFDIPASTKFGISFEGSNNVRLNFDIEHTEFSDVASVGNPMINFLDCPTLGGADFESCLGGKNGPGFGWEDMTTYKFGIEWTPTDTTSYRFGYSYGEQPIQEADVMFNILAPGIMEQHITFGMTKRNADGGAWNFMLMYAPTNTVEGISMFDPGQTIELKMSQFEFEVSYLW